MLIEASSPLDPAGKEERVVGAGQLTLGGTHNLAGNYGQVQETERKREIGREIR